MKKYLAIALLGLNFLAMATEINENQFVYTPRKLDNQVQYIASHIVALLDNEKAEVELELYHGSLGQERKMRVDISICNLIVNNQCGIDYCPGDRLKTKTKTSYDNEREYVKVLGVRMSDGKLLVEYENRVIIGLYGRIIGFERALMSESSLMRTNPQFD